MHERCLAQVPRTRHAHHLTCTSHALVPLPSLCTNSQLRADGLEDVAKVVSEKALGGKVCRAVHRP
jgi:hypothetical protein